MITAIINKLFLKVCTYVVQLSTIITKLLLLLLATTTVNLLFNGTVVANGIAVEGPMLHGKKIPSFFQKVAVTNVHKRTKLLFKTSFDDSDYVNVGEVIAWPSSLIQSL